jgi:hypothetical protein
MALHRGQGRASVRSAWVHDRQDLRGVDAPPEPDDAGAGGDVAVGARPIGVDAEDQVREAAVPGRSLGVRPRRAGGVGAALLATGEVLVAIDRPQGFRGVREREYRPTLWPGIGAFAAGAAAVGAGAYLVAEPGAGPWPWLALSSGVGAIGAGPAPPRGRGAGAVVGRPVLIARAPGPAGVTPVR